MDLRRFQTGQLVSVPPLLDAGVAAPVGARHRTVVTVAAVLTLALAMAIVAGGFVSTKRQARIAEMERDGARGAAAKRSG